MHRGPLMSELEDAVRHVSQEKRVRTLRGITDLFLGAKERLSEEQVEVFDEVLCHLITRMEARALIELSERLAPINNAPTNVIHTLAVDDEIAIAGPVLSLSDRLTTPDLVERGDTSVITSLVENAGAKLSEKAYANLVDKTDADESLLEKLGLRLDIPIHIFRRLLQRVSDAVRGRLMAVASPERRDDIKEILAGITNDVVAPDDLDSDFSAAKSRVQALHEKGELDQVALLGFVKQRQYAAAVTALATLCSAPVDMLKQMLKDGRNEPLLVPCKAAGISWPTLRALLQSEVLGRIATDDELIKFKNDYNKLSNVTATKVLEFWSEQQKTAR